MIPTFLQPERLRYASITLVPASEPALVARKTDSAPPNCQNCDCYDIPGHVCTPAPLTVVCAWCTPTPATTDPVSHGICDACLYRVERDADQDEEPGSRCGRGCGNCGRCD